HLVHPETDGFDGSRRGDRAGSPFIVFDQNAEHFEIIGGPCALFLLLPEGFHLSQSLLKVCFVLDGSNGHHSSFTLILSYSACVPMNFTHMTCPGNHTLRTSR